jgi:hypothetical protein
MTARTQISILSQYMNFLQTTQRKPKIIRNNRDIETSIFANYYFALNRIEKPEVKLDNIYYYRINTKNQRIKSFWQKFTITQTNP